MIIFNWIGLLMVLVAVVVANVTGLLGWLIFRNETAALFMGSCGGIGLLIGNDLWYRFRHHRTKGRTRFLLHSAGGHIWFIPVYLLPGFVLAMALIISAFR